MQDDDSAEGQSVQVVEDRQQLYSSFGNAFSLAVEFVAVPFIFAGLGHLFDRRLGTGTLFALVLFVFGVVGMFVRTWYRYAEAMTAAETEALWHRGPDPINGRPS